MDRQNRKDEQESERNRNRENELHADERADESTDERAKDSNLDWRSNPPRTTTGRMTSPKFGSATSGGGEFEPGPEQD